VTRDELAAALERRGWKPTANTTYKQWQHKPLGWCTVFPDPFDVIEVWDTTHHYSGPLPFTEADLDAILRAVGAAEDVCRCEQWQKGLDELNGFIGFANVHGMEYGQPPFVYCPWCGKRAPKPLDRRTP